MIQDEPWNFQSKLSDYNLNVPNCVLQNLTEDKHLIEDDRFVCKTAAKQLILLAKNKCILLILLDPNCTCKTICV